MRVSRCLATLGVGGLAAAAVLIGSPTGWERDTPPQLFERPTLEVTWAGPLWPDITAPAAPVDLTLGALDTRDGSAFFNFTPGRDSGANASGVHHNEFRERPEGESAFLAWVDLDGGDGDVEELSDGQRIELQVRTVDEAGNESAATSGTFVATAGSQADAFDESARAWLSEAYGMSATTAQNWLDVQARGIELARDIRSSSASESFAGMRFDNEAQQVHIKLRSAAATTIVKQLAAKHELSSTVTIEIGRRSLLESLRFW